MKVSILLAAVVGAAAAVPQQQRRLVRNPNWHPVRPEDQAQEVTTAASGTASGGAAAAREDSEGSERAVPWKAAVYMGGGLLAGIGIGIAIIFAIKRKQEEAPAETPAEAQDEEVAEGAPAPPAEEEQPPAEEVEPPEESKIDYEKLFLSLAQRAAQLAGPKLAKTQAVRSVIEDRMTTMKSKVTTFFLGELSMTVAAVFKAMEAEEAMMLLDLHNTLGGKFPPAAVLLAGLLSPILLTLRKVSHLLQVALGLLPIAVLVIWAVIHDYDTVCAIPTLFAWSYTTAGLALVLTLAHLMLMLKIRSGEAVVNEKAKAMQERLEACQGGSAEMGLAEAKEVAVCASVLLQHALLAEDAVRRSFWHTLTGAGSVVWVLSILWNFVVVIGWTFMPGGIAFHPKAALVAPDDYCGALVTVFVARVTCVLHLIFLFVSVLTMASWLSDRVIDSPGYRKTVLSWAEKADKDVLGIPVMQVLVKAFVLRGGADMASSQLALSMQEKASLQSQRDAAQSKADAIEARLKQSAQEEGALRVAAGFNDQADLERSVTQLSALNRSKTGELEAEGAAQLAEMKVQAAALQETTAKEIQAVFNKIMEAAKAAQNTEAYKAAMAKMKETADQAQARASQMGEQLSAENLQAAMEQAQRSAELGMAQAQEAAEKGLSQAQEAMNSEQVQSAMAQAQQVAEKGLAQAQEATGSK